MNEYNQKALEFLNACPAELSIAHVGRAINHLWDEKEPRDMYSFILKTQRGSMNGTFWDSFNNTRLRRKNLRQYCAENKGILLSDLTKKEQQQVAAEFEQKIADAKPNAYTILSCLEKYDVGSLDDFIHEFGYDPKNTKDWANVTHIYNAVVQEYRDLCRIFTPEQIEMLREIY